MKSAARHSVTSHRHEGEPRRERRDLGICFALGISMIALTAGVPTRVLGGQPSKVGQAQRITPVLFLIPKVEAAERTDRSWRPPPRGSGRRAFQGQAAATAQRLQKVDEGPRQDASVAPAPQPPQRPSAPALVAPLSFNAEAAVATRFDVSVDGRPEDLPPGTVVRVSGLPSGATLSGGEANADRGWVVPLWGLDDLKIRVSFDVSATSISSCASQQWRRARRTRCHGSRPARDHRYAKPIGDGFGRPTRRTSGHHARDSPPQHPHAPALVVPLVLNAEAAVAMRFDVSIGGRPEDLPPGTVVRVWAFPAGPHYRAVRPVPTEAGWCRYGHWMILRSGFPLTRRASSISSLR